MGSINSDNRRIARQVSRRTIYMPPRIEIPVVVRCHVTLRGSLAYPINLNRYYIYFNKALRASLTPILFSFHFSPTLRLLLLFIRIILRNLFCFYFISTLSLPLSLEIMEGSSDVVRNIDRKSSIEAEPRTLGIDQIQYARVSVPLLFLFCAGC